MNPQEKSYSLEKADQLIKNSLKYEKHVERLLYSLHDSILFLLYADPEYPIHGRIRFVKEVFLLVKEVLPKEKVEQIIFIKHRFGPYTPEIEYAVDDMVLTNYVFVEGRKNSRNESIGITKKGMVYIAPRFDKLAENIKIEIKRKRAEWDSLTTAGVLNYVYTHYPDYLENSVLKNRHEQIDWKDEAQE